MSHPWSFYLPWPQESGVTESCQSIPLLNNGSSLIANRFFFFKLISPCFSNWSHSIYSCQSRIFFAAAEPPSVNFIMSPEPTHLQRHRLPTFHSLRRIQLIWPQVYHFQSPLTASPTLTTILQTQSLLTHSVGSFSVVCLPWNILFSNSLLPSV